MMNSWECLLLTAVAGIVFVVASATNDPTCEDLYHPNGPRITPCKKEIILHKGQNFSLKCQANSAIQFKQQEVPEENIGNFSVLPRYVTDENTEYKYEITLELQNVDRYAIGYYACIDASVKEDVLNYLIDEPNNTETISYIYIYVDGTDSMYAPMREVVMSKSNGYVVECRPTTPDVQVELLVADIAENTYKRYSPKLGFVFDSDVIEVLTDSVQLTIFTCGFKKQNKTVDKDLFFVKQQKDQPPPRVIGGNKEFLEGESFSLNCSVNYTHNSALNLTWKYPSNAIKNTIIEESNNDLVSGGVFYRNITIVNATKEHAGVYTCFSKNNCGEKQDSFEKKFLDKPYLILKEFVKRESNIIDTTQKTLGFSVEIKSYPPAKFTFYRKDSEINPAKNGKYKVSWKSFSHEAALTVYKDSVEDSDNYTLVATNGYITKNVTYDLRFKSAPVVFFGNTDKTCIQNMRTSLQCEVTGYPLPTVTWIFSDGSEMESKYIEMSSIYKETAILDIQCQFTGNITCKASNERGMQAQTRRLIVYELANGFGIYNQIDNGTIWFSENQEASVKCLASIYDYTNVTWWMDDKNLEEMVEYSENQFSLVAKLKINQISLNHSGTYECRGIRFDGTATFEKVNIEVAELKAPKVTITSNVNENVHKYQPVQLNCQAEGVPRPTIKWYKNDEIFAPNDTNVQVINQIVNRTTVSSNIFIVQMEEEYHGTYECVASNDDKEAKQSTMLVLKEAAYMKYLIVIAIIVFVFIILVIYLTCKIRKEKRFRKELAAAGLLYFKEGVTKSLNPDVGIDEQAELLPYDEKFEFPAEKLTLGKQLGAGAFGVVYKAQARGIINAEETTEVAVKMVKKTADNMFIKALASELKIMVHLGKHINIVNLLGACTKNVGKRELVVIVEYCKFGNIHNYMQRHREVFIDQFSDNNKEKNFGKVNRGYDSTGSTGVQSDYGTANTQDTDHTFLTNNTNRTSRKNVPSQPTEVVKASEGYVQPEWRCNYESDYSYDGRSPRPLTSRDLLAWAFQIARGMEYLASRKVLHGDLAARNILLADDNIVKICDFGLARSIYKNDEYRREKNSLLPVKWLAIECMTDCIFSTQSDVWSFGIVLWELFSLAKTPYPNFSPANLLQFLSEGHRLEKPPYADDRIYNLMRRCWEHKPTARPSFTQLQEILGTFLEDNVRNHYVDLNSAYMDLNSKPEGQEDYLAMVCAPDYNNLVTPSPHHYVNELNDARSFFPPTPTKVDEEGYLQMSPASNNDIFSPKPAGTKFDFDPRKYNSRPSEASSGGSELTPMLTLNNLPRSGSDSDHEGNASPYLNVCPRIEEETDEVFETKLYNAKNAQNSAVSNPTYITLDVDVEKKPIDVNNYVNIVPNGLVK